MPIARGGLKANYWYWFFNGSLKQMIQQPFDGVHPACYHNYFPVKSVGPEPHLVNTGFPKHRLIIPIPVEYTRSLLSREFWEKPGITIKNLKPPPIPTVAYRVEGEKSWTRASETETELYMRPISSAVAIDRLLGINSAERSIYGPQSVAANLAKVQQLEEESTKKTDWIRAVIELCELSRGEPTYDDNFETLLKELDKVIHAHHDILTIALELEQQGEISAKGEVSF